MAWNRVLGEKFRPTKQVLTGYYLSKKVSGQTDGPIFPLISNLDVYEQEPSELREKAAHVFDDGKMYFFSSVHKKYERGEKNIKRKAGDGAWKKTGNDSVVTNENGDEIGKEISLAYHENDRFGKAKIKTQWLMKEYMLHPEGKYIYDGKKLTTTLCVVYYHQHDNKRKQRDSSNNQNEEQSSPPPYVVGEEEEPERSLSGKRQCHSRPFPGGSSFVTTTDLTTTVEQLFSTSSNNLSFYQNYPVVSSGSTAAPLVPSSSNPEETLALPRALNNYYNLSSTFEQALHLSDINQNIPASPFFDDLETFIQTLESDGIANHLNNTSHPVENPSSNDEMMTMNDTQDLSCYSFSPSVTGAMSPPPYPFGNDMHYLFPFV